MIGTNIFMSKFDRLISRVRDHPLALHLLRRPPPRPPTTLAVCAQSAPPDPDSTS